MKRVSALLGHARLIFSAVMLRSVVWDECRLEVTATELVRLRCLLAFFTTTIHKSRQWKVSRASQIVVPSYAWLRHRRTTVFVFLVVHSVSRYFAATFKLHIIVRRSASRWYGPARSADLRSLHTALMHTVHLVNSSQKSC